MGEEYDLLYGGGYSIKDYYTESGNPRQMRGASELLCDCAEAVKRLLEGYEVFDENVIADGSATISALVPREHSAEIVKMAEAVYRDMCRTASAAFVAVPYDSGDYRGTKQLALAAYENRRAAKFTAWEFQNAVDQDFAPPLGYYLIDADLRGQYADDIPARCPRCRLRDPVYQVSHNNSEVSYLCTTCAKREAMSGERKYLKRSECGEGFDDGYEINTFADVADSDGRIALLYADVNNLGGQRHDASFEDDRAFHKTVAEAVKAAVYAAINKAMTAVDGTKSSKFEIIALAGDDVCLILPGASALLAAKTLVEEFGRNTYGLTISASACVANDTTAIAYMRDIVEKRLGCAKKRARHEKQSAVFLSFFEQPTDLFPMTADEFSRFAELLQESLSVSSSAARNIAEARRELLFDEEFDLFLDYYLSRDVQPIKKSRGILTKVRNAYSLGRRRNPWPDFVVWRKQTLRGDNA